MRNRMFIFLFAAMAIIALAACTPQAPATPEADVQTIYVGPQLVDCVGVGPQKCMQIAEHPDGPYQMFYDRIEGFEYEEGYQYELIVRQEPVENPPADASSIRWVLVEQVSKTPVQVETPSGEVEGGPADVSALEGTTWELVSYPGPDGVLVAVIPGSQVTAEIKDGQITGSAGCNNYFASVEIDGEKLIIGPAGSTMMMCPDEGLMDQESAYLAALGQAASYTLRGDQLVLVDADGQDLLIFTAVQQPELAGSSWELVSVNNGKEAVVSLVPGTSVTADFGQDGMLTGSAGCNNYRAGYTLDGESLQIGPAISTRMFCGEPEGLMEQESAYLAAIEKTATYRFDRGMLELRGAEGELLASFSPTPERTLDGEWDLTGYNNGQGGFTSVLSGTTLTAKFVDGQVSGSAGCNNFSGGYTLDGNSIEFSQMVMTLMACSEPEGVMEQESAYLAALQAAATFELGADRLEFFAADGTRLLSYAAGLADAAAPVEAPAADRAALQSVLANLTYPSDATQSGEAPLVAGEYREQAAPDSASQTVVRLWDFALGELADGQPAAAVLLVTSTGGSGTFYDLVLLELGQDPPAVLSSRMLGDRVRVNALQFEGEQVVVDLVTQGPEDPMPLPTRWVRQVHALADGDLVLAEETELGTVTADVVPLLGVNWRWMQMVTPVETITPEDSDRYTLRFLPEGRLSVQADCNVAFGSYTVDQSAIDLEVTGMTLAACPEGSLAEDYVRYLNEAVIYFFQEDGLYMDLPMDTGTLHFAP